MQRERSTEAGLIAFDILRSEAERLAGDMVLMFARLEPRLFMQRVMRRAGAIVSVCCYCGRGYGLKDGQGRSGISDGLCGRPECTDLAWMLVRAVERVQ